MIMGSCPYEDCDAPLWRPICKSPPKLERHECESCQRVIWTYHSRWDPWSMTESDFLSVYEIDEGTKSVTKKI